MYYKRRDFQGCRVSREAGGGESVGAQLERVRVQVKGR